MNAGKGDKPRPVDGQKYREGWDRIFAKPKPVLGIKRGKHLCHFCKSELVYFDGWHCPNDACQSNSAS